MVDPAPSPQGATAIGHDRVLESSLGYFINPLVSVALGVVFLGERLRAAQWTAVLVSISQGRAVRLSVSATL